MSRAEPLPLPVLKSGAVLAMEAVGSPPRPAWQVLLEVLCLLERDAAEDAQ